MHRAALTCTLLLSSACATAPVSTLATRIDPLIEAAGRSGRTVAVALLDLNSGQTFLRNEDVLMHAASTMKVPVMLAIFEAIDRGELDLEQPVLVRNEFRSILDGSLYTLERAEDGDPSLYDAVGQTRPLSELMRRMIVRSSNLSTNLLIELIGAEHVMQLMKTLGANDIRVLRGVEDEKAYAAGMNNMVTARDLMLVFRAIAERRAISPAASAAMIEILRDQEFDEKIPAGIPDGVVVANKTGDITRIHHDAAIIDPYGDPLILVVLTRGYDRGADADQLIASIAREAWSWRQSR